MTNAERIREEKMQARADRFDAAVGRCLRAASDLEAARIGETATEAAELRALMVSLGFKVPPIEGAS